MDNLSINTAKKPKKTKFTRSAAWIISAVAILIICLIFFIITLRSVSDSNAAPEIFNLNQIGTTQDSLLISWDCTSAADEYIINCTNETDQTTCELITDIPFASIDELRPNSNYMVEVIPVKGGLQYSAVSTQCATGEYCEITSMTIDKCTANSVTASWKYNGVNKGFTAIAYVVDIDGKRHLTSSKIEIPADGDSKCTIDGLIPEIEYTIAVMPKTRFNKLGKLNFETRNNSIWYSKLNIIRAVICPENSGKTSSVTKLTSVTAGKPYKISMIITGQASKNDKVNMALFIKNSNGQLVSETNYHDIYTNPDNRDAFTQRIILLNFTAPTQKGEYTACLTIDGELARRIDFDTFGK